MVAEFLGLSIVVEVVGLITVVTITPLRKVRVVIGWIIVLGEASVSISTPIAGWSIVVA